MATEILLMADVQDLGSEGDVVTVADGYARNYLVPKGLGAPVTEATRRRLARMRQDREQAREAELTAAREKANQLTNMSVTIAVKTGGDGKLFGSVTEGDIAAALQAQGVSLDRHTVQLEHPIKELGVFEVTIKLDAEVSATVKVWVVEE
jgi:large subunit ribosomal protein L9